MQDLGGLLSSSCSEESHHHGTVKDSCLSDLRHQNNCVFSLWLLCVTEEDTSLAVLQMALGLSIFSCVFLSHAAQVVSLLASVSGQGKLPRGGLQQGRACFFVIRTRLEAGRAVACSRLVGPVALFGENCACS